MHSREGNSRKNFREREIQQQPPWNHVRCWICKERVIINVLYAVVLIICPPIFSPLVVCSFTQSRKNKWMDRIFKPLLEYFFLFSRKQEVTVSKENVTWLRNWEWYKGAKTTAKQETGSLLFAKKKNHTHLLTLNIKQSSQRQHVEKHKLTIFQKILLLGLITDF